MGDDQGNEFVRQLLQSMGAYLLSLGMDDYGEKGVTLSRLGDLGHLEVADENGDVAFHVVGTDSVELGCQLGLACLQNLSIEHLGALHLHPLNKPLQVRKEKSQ